MVLIKDYLKDCCLKIKFGMFCIEKFATLTNYCSLVNWFNPKSVNECKIVFFRFLFQKPKYFLLITKLIHLIWHLILEIYSTPFGGITSNESVMFFWLKTKTRWSPKYTWSSGKYLCCNVTALPYVLKTYKFLHLNQIL